MECIWIQDEDCIYEDDYTIENQNEFTNNFCKFCLEGKKIEFINDLKYGFSEAFGENEIWEERIAKLIVSKLME